jgi:type III pantothenate kinase
MLLAVDVGNTQTVLGLFDGEALTARWRVATRPQRSADDLAVLLDGLLRLKGLDRGPISALAVASTVPALSPEWARLGEVHLRIEPLVVGPGTRTGVPVLVDNPREVGPDRICNAVGAFARYGGPCIVVDFGTSTNFDAVSDSGEFVGGVLAPGIEVSMEALWARAARLTKVDLVAPRTVIGKSTVTALQSGAAFGFAGQVDGIVRRMRGELGEESPAIATGGLASLILPLSETLQHHEPDVTLEGLRLVWNLNRA